MTEDEEMLSLVLSDALQGVDIISQYPDFYRELLADAELRQTFLDALELLEKEKAGQLFPLPEETIPDLGFLKTAVASPRPAIENPVPGQWRVTWRLLQAQLTRIFQPPALAYRPGSFSLEDKSDILLRSQFKINGQSYDIFLEAVCPVNEPDNLRLYLAAAPLTDTPLPAMSAHLQWGDIHRTAVTDSYGYVRFQPIPLTAVLDKTGQNIRADLQLTLEPDAEL